MQQRAPGAELSIAIFSGANADEANVTGTISALTTALACEFAGLKDVCVYEHSPSVASTSNAAGNHSVELSPNASRILRSLGVLDELRAHSFEPQFIHQRSYRTGFQLAVTALGAMAEGRYNAPFLHVQGSALLDVLRNRANARGIKRTRVDTLQGITQSAAPADQVGQLELQFAAGPPCSHDVLLVADDPNQKIRALSNAAPVSRTPTPLTHWRGTLPQAELPAGAFGSVVTQWLGPTQHFSYHFTAGGEALEFSALAETPAQSKEQLLAVFANWHPSINRLISTAASLTREPIYQTAQVQRLAHGQIGFLGAGCHDLMPHLPQQQALGIEDAWVISRLLEQWEDEPAAGLVEFERYRLPRAQRLQSQASARANMLCATAPLATWRRNLALTFGSRFLPELAMQKNDWLYGYDAVNGFL